MMKRLPRTLPALAAGALLLAALGIACSSSDSKSNPRSTAGTKPPSGSSASAISTTIQVATGQAAAGLTAAIEVKALGLVAPGLGAWQMNITYDTAIVTPTDCQTPANAVCNTHFADDTVRLVGAAGTGLTGDVVLGTITFQCKAAGTATLKVTPDLLADGTIGNPKSITKFTAQDGSITCS